MSVSSGGAEPQYLESPHTRACSTSPISVLRGSPYGTPPQVDVDSRPSDALNLAVRFEAPMFISRHVACEAHARPGGTGGTGGGALSELYNGSESHAEIARSIRDTLSHFEVTGRGQGMGDRCAP